MVELGLKSQQRTAALAVGMDIQGGKSYAVHTGPGGSEDFVAIKQHSGA